MVTVKYHGRFGNNLFQFCFGRILAEVYDLQLLPYDGQYSHLIQSELKTGKVITNPTFTITDSTNEVFPLGSGLIIDGYFQQWYFYKNWKNEIKKWLKFPETEFRPHSEDIAIHIRRSDFGWSCNAGMLPLSFYKDFLYKTNFNRVYIYGGCSHANEQQDIDNQVIDAFKEFNPVYSKDDPITDFVNIMKFRRAIQSMSTFMWWSTFLSDVNEEIYSPISIGGGYWDKDNSLINLRVDEPRYKYVENVRVEKW